MFKLDVKEYYLSGEPEELARDASAIVQDHAERQPVHRALMLLLVGQYVTCDLSPVEIWYCTLGSGMGLRHAGEVADAALWHRAERQLFCNTEYQVAHRVVVYFRLRDDIFLAGNSRCILKKAVGVDFMKAAGYSRITCDGISNESVKMLEIRVSIRNGSFRTIAEPKAASLGMPLGVECCHPPEVHLSWPRACISRTAGLCTTLEATASVKAKFLQRFRDHYVDQRLLETICSPTEKEGLRRPCA